MIAKLIVPVTKEWLKSSLFGYLVAIRPVMEKLSPCLSQKKWQNLAKIYTICQLEKLLSKDQKHGSEDAYAGYIECNVFQNMISSYKIKWETQERWFVRLLWRKQYSNGSAGMERIFLFCKRKKMSYISLWMQHRLFIKDTSEHLQGKSIKVGWTVSLYEPLNFVQHFLLHAGGVFFSIFKILWLDFTKPQWFIVLN